MVFLGLKKVCFPLRAAAAALSVHSSPLLLHVRPKVIHFLHFILGLVPIVPINFFELRCDCLDTTALKSDAVVSSLQHLSAATSGKKRIFIASIGFFDFSKKFLIELVNEPGVQPHLRYQFVVGALLWLESHDAPLTVGRDVEAATFPSFCLPSARFKVYSCVAVDDHHFMSRHYESVKQASSSC